MLRAISSFATGRRSKWVVVSFWVVLGVGLAQLQPKLQDATTNENEAFLPASAESTEVNDLLEDRFADGRTLETIVAYHRDGGLTRDDRARIGADAAQIASSAELEALGTPIAPFDADGKPREVGDVGGAGGLPSLVSPDGDTALIVVPTLSQDSEEIREIVTAIDEITPAPDDELEAYVTGTGGFISDSIEVFESIDVTLLLVTVTLVLVLLLAIYRSPVIALVPLFVVGLAYLIAAAAVLGLVEAGVFEVNGQTTAILIVLMFGAGVDYSLLIVARYREELRRFPDKHEAMAHATERTAPAILSAGGTVLVAMLVLMLADFKATQTMGPVLALGIAIMLAAGLTFLPALLSVLGRLSFWPAVPRVGTDQRAPLDLWRRLGHFVHERPVLSLGLTVLILGAGALGNLQDRGIIDFGEGFRDDVQSAEGLELIADELAAGQAAPSQAVVDARVAEPVATALAADPAVDSAFPVARSEDGELARLDFVLADPPFSDAAANAIPELRDTARGAAGGRTALLGGITAENYDTSEALSSDAKLIVPLVLALIAVILMVLLRAVVAPLYLVATVVLSFAFALGASSLIFTELLGQPDRDPGLPTFAFVFLVALGVDYNIFLISRIREEAERHPTKEAVIAGLERTGGVITSAGLILAGTFSALMALPLEALFQFGFTIAFGLLIDTFMIRTITVPAITFLLGEKSWWPGRIARREPDPAPATAP